MITRRSIRPAAGRWQTRTHTDDPLAKAAGRVYSVHDQCALKCGAGVGQTVTGGRDGC